MKSAMAFILLLTAPTLGFAQNVRLSRGASMTSAAPEPRVVMEEMLVQAKDPGIQIYVRNKHLAGTSRFTPETTVLFVHGATYPAETSFDLPLNGLSWMDYIAQRGYDVYLMDVRGYGRSTRPPRNERTSRPERANRRYRDCSSGYQRGRGPHPRPA